MLSPHYHCPLSWGGWMLGRQVWCGEIGSCRPIFICDFHNFAANLSISLRIRHISQENSCEHIRFALISMRTFTNRTCQCAIAKHSRPLFANQNKFAFCQIPCLRSMDAIAFFILRTHHFRKPVLRMIWSSHLSICAQKVCAARKCEQKCVAFYFVRKSVVRIILFWLFANSLLIGCDRSTVAISTSSLGSSMCEHHFRRSECSIKICAFANVVMRSRRFRKVSAFSICEPYIW